MKNKEERFDWQGILVASLLMIVGFVTIYFTWGGMELNFKNIYDYFCKYCLLIVVLISFIGAGIFCWIMYINNVFTKPKMDILYLRNTDEDVYSFLDSKGRKFLFSDTSDRKFDVGKFYTVIKTKDIIKNVLEISNTNFPVCMEKSSFWLNWYSPIGNFENILILPILYIVFILFLFSNILKGFMRITELLFLLVAGIFVIYDIVYKIKKNKILKNIESYSNAEYQNEQINKIDSNEELLNMQTKVQNATSMIGPIYRIIQLLLFTGFCVWFFMKSNANIIRIVSVVFFICGLLILIKSIVDLVTIINLVKSTKVDHVDTNKTEKTEKTEKIEKYTNISSVISKSYIIIVFFLWFGFLGIWIYRAIKSKVFALILFGILLLIAGIAAAYKTLKKKR